MPSPTQWTWVWVKLSSWWWTGMSGVLQPMGFQRFGHDWVTELNWNYGGGNEDNGDLLQKIPCMYCYTQCPLFCNRPPPTHMSAGDFWTLKGKSGSVSFRGTAPFSRVLVYKVLFVPSKSLCPSPVHVWQPCGEVNGDLLQEGLCYAQVCYTQSPCSCGSPLLTHTSTGDAQT